MDVSGKFRVRQRGAFSGRIPTVAEKSVGDRAARARGQQRIARTPRAAQTRFASLVERGLVREIVAGPQAPSGGSSEQYRNDISSLPTDSRSARAAG